MHNYPHRSLVLNTAPSTQIVSTALMKTYLQVDDDTENPDIRDAIISARLAIEAYLGRSLISTTWNLWLDAWPRDRSRENPPQGVFNLPIDAFDATLNYIELPRPPLGSVTHVKYYNTGDTVATFASSKYFVDTKSTPGRVVLNTDESWPTTLLRDANWIDVQFVAGYGTSETDVPESILLAVKQMTKKFYRDMTGLYEDQESTAYLAESDKAGKSGLPKGVEQLLMRYRIPRL